MCPSVKIKCHSPINIAFFFFQRGGVFCVVTYRKRIIGMHDYDFFHAFCNLLYESYLVSLVRPPSQVMLFLYIIQAYFTFTN